VKRTSLCSLMLLLALLPAGAWGKGTPGGDFAPEERQLVIKEAYASLARLTAAGGETLGFKLEDFRTVEPSQFDSVLWLDLVSMPGGDMLDVGREEKQFNGRTDAVIYRPRWSLDGKDFLTTPEGLSLLGKTVGDIIAELVPTRPDMATVKALTSYGVTVHYQGKSRSYDAAVLWLAARPGRRATLYFVDNITQGVEEAVRERPIRPQPRRLGPVAKTATCESSSSTRRFSKNLTGTNGHFEGGFHKSQATVDFECTCDTSCVATCEPSFAAQSCDDNGYFTTDTCHKMATNASLSTTGTADGRTSPPSCAAGFGCIQRACLYCMCGLGVEVEVRGTTVQFSASGTPDWEGNLTFSWQCASCQQPAGGSDPGPLYETPDPGTGGGGGGGPRGCCSWQTTCYYQNGVYTCTPTSTCAVWGC
jgi:hypothetical protein